MSTTARTSTELVGSYRDGQGQVREVLVRCMARERYEVVEVAADGGRRLIEELAGKEESRSTAVAVARDYLEQQQLGVAR